MHWSRPHAGHPPYADRENPAQYWSYEPDPSVARTGITNPLGVTIKRSTERLRAYHELASRPADIARRPGERCLGAQSRFLPSGSLTFSAATHPQAIPGTNDRHFDILDRHTSTQLPAPRRRADLAVRP